MKTDVYQIDLNTIEFYYFLEIANIGNKKENLTKYICLS